MRSWKKRKRKKKKKRKKMIDPFAELLVELGNELGTTLHLDKKSACTLNISDQFRVQLECDPHQENILVATFICDLPPGKFRENILRDALKSNDPFPISGTLAYSERNNKLALFAHLRLASLNGRALSEFLNAFIEKANGWRTGVETGQTSSLTSRAK
jgi:hypothetical protein